MVSFSNVLFSLMALVCVAVSETFTNPILWEDLADNDVFRVDDVYYYSASTMHYSPGAPVLRSYDLVNWEYIGHSVPSLSWSSAYNLTDSTNAYVKGIWASSIRYRKSYGLFYFVACVEFSKTYVYTASEASGPWTLRSTIDKCYYDAGLLIDDDTDTMYVAYGAQAISVAQLSADGFSEEKSMVVFNSTDYIEGSRFYKRDGRFYIFVTKPSDEQHILKGDEPFGTYERAPVAIKLTSPVLDGGSPHQGSLVDTQNGDWYYMGFSDAYPGGRIPVLAPITWNDTGYPEVTLVDGEWSTIYDYPLPQHPVTSTLGIDTFESESLDPTWEWNHNPDEGAYSIGNGLTLNTATVTDDFFLARNTLTKRIHGPIGTAIVELDVSGMLDGDVAGLAMFRDQSAWIGVRRAGDDFTIDYVDNLVLNSTSSGWVTSSKGVVGESISTNDTTLWLKTIADIAPSGTKTATFWYSADSENFAQIGNTFALNTDWTFFMGYRYGIFNYATRALGGSVKVQKFTCSTSS